jgi:hypothetical protein
MVITALPQSRSRHAGEASGSQDELGSTRLGGHAGSHPGVWIAGQADRPGPDRKGCVSCRFSGHDLCPWNADHPGDFAGYLKCGLALFAVGAGSLAQPVIQGAAPNIIDDLGGHVAEQNGLITWPAISEVALVKSPRITRPKIGEDSRAA